MLATCALIVLGFGSQPYDMGDHMDHDHKEDGTWDGAGATEDGTWDGAGATEDAVSMPTMAECMACYASMP